MRFSAPISIQLYEPDSVCARFGLRRIQYALLRHVRSQLLHPAGAKSTTPRRQPDAYVALVNCSYRFCELFDLLCAFGTYCDILP